MTFLEWLDSQTKASRVEACELTLARFRERADSDRDFAGVVGTAVWRLLATDPGEDASRVLAEMRSRAQALGRQCLEDLSSRLLDAGCHDEILSEARRLVAFWFRAVALCADPAPQTTSAQHIAAKYERAFAALGRAMKRIGDPQDEEARREAA